MIRLSRGPSLRTRADAWGLRDRGQLGAFRGELLELDPPNRSAVASMASATAGRMKRAVMQAASLVLPSSRR